MTFKEEFEHIKSYSVIQRMRHNDSLEDFYDISEHEHGCIVPKFILQPIVENIIKHAMTGDNEKYFISLGAKIDGDDLIISVNDDGDGIPADKLEKICRSLPENVQSSDFGVGLRNVHLRLKITYGDGYGISVLSHEHIGERKGLLMNGFELIEKTSKTYKPEIIMITGFA